MIRKSARKFFAAHPLLGLRASPRPLREQQRSVYYWWWQYLRRNEQYLRCCERSGTGVAAKLYADFGDVRSDDFRTWWQSNERGGCLFAEAPAATGVTELASAAQWNTAWTAAATMVVAIPLTWAKRDIHKTFAKLLKKRHSRRRGRLPLRGAQTSTARYPLAQNFTAHSLQRDLAVYDARQTAVMEAQRTGQRRKTWYTIGCELKLVPSAMPSAAELAKRAADADKVNTMTVAASRAYKRAAMRVESVGRGVFP